MKISAEEPDWQREKISKFWCPSQKLILSLRDYQKYKASRTALSQLRMKLSVLRHRFWSIITGADIPLTVNIQGGLLLPHPNGVVIHPDVEIGPNCLIHQQVTLGIKAGKRPPKLMGHVDIGAGAKILGGIIIGKHSTIGANAVVLCDVPDYAVMAGVPARVVGWNSLSKKNSIKEEVNE